MSEDHPENVHRPTSPETGLARMAHLRCAGCYLELSWEVNPRTGIQNPDVLTCRNNRCKQFDKRWVSPDVTLLPAPGLAPSL